MELRHSESIGKIIEALAKASGEFTSITKGCTNPYYGQKYADLSSLIEATRPALAANNLAVLQTPRVIANRAVEITSMLAHSSGEFMAFDISFPAWQDTKDGQRFDAQTIGSAITYGRRYSYQSLLNISAEEDDDGNATVKRNGEAEARANGNGKSKKVTAGEAAGFRSAVKVGEKTEEQVREYFGSIGIERTEDMRKADFDNAMKWAVDREGKAQPIVAVMDQPIQDEIAS